MDSRRLGDIATVLGAATVSEAYEIKELLEDGKLDMGKTTSYFFAS